MPVIGFLDGQSARVRRISVAPFRQGLREAGYVEGQNVAIEYRWRTGNTIELPALAADLVRRRVAVIVAHAPEHGSRRQGRDHDDPDRVQRRRRPGRIRSRRQPEPAGRQCNRLRDHEDPAGAKQLELLRELVPNAAPIGFLVDPTNPIRVRHPDRVAAGCASTLKSGSRVSVTSRTGDTFVTLAQLRAEAVVVGNDIFFAAGATVSSPWRTLRGARDLSARIKPSAGGLMGYGAASAMPII